MKINLKQGIDKLLFGMKQPDVIALYGKPDREYKDEDKNVIFLYNPLKLRLTFYQDEDFRLGYLITSNPEAEISGQKIIGKKISELTEKLQQAGMKKWETETFDMATNHFNEASWLILEEEFGEVIKIEMGAIIKDNDEFDWKFTK